MSLFSDVERRRWRNPWNRLNFFAPIERWPEEMRRIFWCSNLKYRHRLHVASFGYLNGIPIQHLLDALWFTNKSMNSEKVYKIRGLYTYWSDLRNGEERRAKRFAFHTADRRVLDLNGRLWTPQVPVNNRLVPYGYTYPPRGEMSTRPTSSAAEYYC